MKTLVNVPPNFGEWVRNTRLVDYNMTQNEMWIKSRLPKRTVIAIESGQIKSHTESTIKQLAEAFDWPAYKLIEKIQKLWKEQDPSILGINEFAPMLASFTAIDDYIRHLVRSVDDEMRFAYPDIIRDSYRDLLFAQVSQRFPDLHDPLSDFSTFLSKPETLRVLLNSFPRPDLTINVHDYFSRIDFTLDDGRTLGLDQPELLCDCSCLPSEDGSAIQCRIHSHELGEEVLENLKKNVKITYKGFDFFWKDLSSLWPPSIDSFYLIDNIINNTDLLVNPDRKISSIMDIGAGTGFLGIILSYLFDGVEQVCLSDWSTTSYLYSAINWFINAQKHQRNLDFPFEFRVAVNTYWDYFINPDQKKDAFDLVICNPPYLPIPDRFLELRTEYTNVGTELLEHVISRGRDLGKTVIIQSSHLAQESAEKAAEKNGVRLKPIGKPKMVPFRIRPAFENRDYMNWLLDEEAEGKETPWTLIRNETPYSKNMRHQYYHYIQSYFLEW